MKNNRIAILIPQFYWGGMPRVASNLIKYLQCYYDIDLILVNSKLEIREETYHSNIIRLKDGKINKLISLFKILRKNNYKAVISFGIIDNILNILFTNKKSKKIITEHSTKSFDNETETNKLKKQFYIFSMKFLYPLANEVVCVSKGIQDDLKNKYGIKNSKVIYNIVE